MSARDLLSGTLTFLLFVILTPFLGAGSHAGCVSARSPVRPAYQHHPSPTTDTQKRSQHYHSLHINFTRIHSVFTASRNSLIIMIIPPIHEHCMIYGREKSNIDFPRSIKVWTLIIIVVVSRELFNLHI